MACWVRGNEVGRFFQLYNGSWWMDDLCEALDVRRFLTAEGRDEVCYGGSHYG